MVCEKSPVRSAAVGTVTRFLPPGLLDLPVFLRIEEEQLLFVGVEPVRNISRTAHREAKSAKPIDGLGQAIAVVKEVVGVQLFMPLVFVHRAVKVFGAGLGD